MCHINPRALLLFRSQSACSVTWQPHMDPSSIYTKLQARLWILKEEMWFKTWGLWSSSDSKEYIYFGAKTTFSWSLISAGKEEAFTYCFINCSPQGFLLQPQIIFQFNLNHPSLLRDALSGMSFKCLVDKRMIEPYMCKYIVGCRRQCMGGGANSLNSTNQWRLKTNKLFERSIKLMFNGAGSWDRTRAELTGF